MTVVRGVRGNAVTEQRRTRQEPARAVGRDCPKESGADRSFVTTPAGSFLQGLGHANYPGQTGRFTRVFAGILSPLLWG